MINIIIIRIVIIVITLSTIFFVLLLDTNTAFADDCSNLKGARGSNTYKYGSSGGLTGRDCNALRKQDGSGVGPKDYSDIYTCIGSAGCVIRVSFCDVTDDGSLCEESWTERNCEKAPPACSKPGSPVETDISKIFGRILPPPSIGTLGFGSAGISKFLSNLIILIYTIATIVFVFMLIWGAFEWLTSGGDKEKAAQARARITHAIIGIILFAVAFAVIQVLGTFTGFTFFKGQKP